MNKSFSLGLLIVGLILYFGVFKDAKNPGMFLDPHAILLVLGGTLAAGLIAYKGSFFGRTMQFILWNKLFGKKANPLEIAEQISSVRASYLVGTAPQEVFQYHPFLVEGTGFLNNKNLQTDAMESILRTRSNYFQKIYRDDAKALMGLGKYPPAFGLLGASTGMIEMMQNLGTGGTTGIGEAMAVALVATFWGIAIANFIILPLADAASKAVQEDQMIRDLIIDGLLLMRADATDSQFKWHLRGYLSLADRSSLTIFDPNQPQHFNTFVTETPEPQNDITQISKKKAQRF